MQVCELVWGGGWQALVSGDATLRDEDAAAAVVADGEGREGVAAVVDRAVRHSMTYTDTKD